MLYRCSRSSFGNNVKCTTIKIQMLYTKNHITLSYDLLGGELKDVPLEIVHTMITYSCKEGNTVETAIRGLSKKINAFPQHGGFLWNNTLEGTNLWSRILEYKQYGLYLALIWLHLDYKSLTTLIVTNIHSLPNKIIYQFYLLISGSW